MAIKEEFGQLVSEFESLRDMAIEEITKIKSEIENIKEDLNDLKKELKYSKKIK